jgi:type IV fimbrial biogenesis protein FimT
MNRHDATLGFTLIELTMGLTIAALLTMLAAPSFTSFLRDSEIRSSTEALVDGLKVARSEAIRRNQLVSFTLTGSSGTPSWAVRQVSDNSTIQTYSAQEGGTHVAVAVQPAGANSVAFNRLGRVVPVGAGTPTIQQLALNSTLTSGARTLQVYVDGVHGIRMCDPSPLLATLVPPDPRAC